MDPETEILDGVIVRALYMPVSYEKQNACNSRFGTRQFHLTAMREKVSRRIRACMHTAPWHPYRAVKSNRPVKSPAMSAAVGEFRVQLLLCVRILPDNALLPSTLN